MLGGRVADVDAVGADLGLGGGVDLLGHRCAPELCDKFERLVGLPVQWSPHAADIPQHLRSARPAPGRCARPARPGCPPGRRSWPPRPPGRPWSTPTPRRARASRGSRRAPARPARCTAGAPSRRSWPRRRAPCPDREEKSKAPSPVITRSQRRARSGRPTASATMSRPEAPGRAEQQQRRSPARRPRRPPCRARSSCRWPRPAARAGRRRPAGGRPRTPFWGPKTLVAPRSPSSGLSTSEAATSSTPSTRARAAARSTSCRSPRPVAPRVSASGRRRGGAERGQQARSPVVGARAAEPHDHPGGALLAGGADELADAVRRGVLGVPLLGRGQVQPAGLRALDVGGAAVDQHRAGHRLAVGPEHVDREQLTAQRGVQDVDEARTAVGHRDQLELVVGSPPSPPRGDGLGRLDGAQRSGELVRCDQHAHGPIQHDGMSRR